MVETENAEDGTSKKIGRDVEEDSERITVFYQFWVSEDKGWNVVQRCVEILKNFRVTRKSERQKLITEPSITRGDERILLFFTVFYW